MLLSAFGSGETTVGPSEVSSTLFATFFTSKSGRVSVSSEDASMPRDSFQRSWPSKGTLVPTAIGCRRGEGGGGDEGGAGDGGDKGWAGWSVSGGGPLAGVLLSSSPEGGTRSRSWTLKGMLRGKKKDGWLDR